MRATVKKDRQILMAEKNKTDIIFQNIFLENNVGL